MTIAPATAKATGVELGEAAVVMLCASLWTSPLLDTFSSPVSPFMVLEINPLAIPQRLSRAARLRELHLPDHWSTWMVSTGRHLTRLDVIIAKQGS